MNAMRTARSFSNFMILDQEADLLGRFQKEYGMEVVIPDKKAFMDSAQKFYSKEKYDKLWGKGMYEKIQNVK
jgi:TRAP-type C4-dicarboxylate transport system substrate-binding protein